MSVVTVRNLPEETHRALKIRAAEHGRSTEAEIRAILEEAVRPASRVRVGSALAAVDEREGETHPARSAGRTATKHMLHGLIFIVRPLLPRYCGHRRRVMVHDHPALALFHEGEAVTRRQCPGFAVLGI